VVIPEYSYFGGRHPEVGALKNTLACLGVQAPHSGEAYSEPLLFGLGGGIGFAYFLFERAGTHPIHIETRVHTRETERPEFYQTIAARIGAQLQLQNSSSASAATTNLRRQLNSGRPPIVGVDGSKMPYLGLHRSLNSYYSVVVYGLDVEANQVMLADRCSQPVTVTAEQFKEARHSSWSPKFRAVVISKPEAEPDLAAAVTEAIRDTCRHMNEGLGITNFGLRGLEKWATVMTSSKEKKSWPKIFSPGPLLYEALFSVFSQIAARSSAGNANRWIYAEYLDEAADIVERPALKEAAEAYRRADREWGEVADAHLPSAVPQFQEAKELALRRQYLFEREGPNAAKEIEAIRNRLIEIEREAGENFPLSFQDSRALLADLRQRILKLRDVEMEALRATEAPMA
jgi:hypothetical protein